jgi:hypothetical protein
MRVTSPTHLIPFNLITPIMLSMFNGDYCLWVVRLEVLEAESMKTTVFWVVAPCSLVGVYQRFRAANTSETSVNFY